MEREITEEGFFGEPAPVEPRIDGKTNATTVPIEVSAGLLMEQHVPQSVVVEDPRRIDPNAMPSQMQPNRMASFKHPEGHRGTVFYDRFTLRIKRWNTYTGHPIDLPEAFKRVPQKEVSTCSQPSADNIGCPSWNGCPYTGHGPFRVIIRHRDYEDVKHANYCYNQWVGFNPEGNPIRQIHLQMDGWVVDTSRRTIPYVTTRIEPVGGNSKAFKRVRYAGEYEVKNLGPMYANTPPASGRPERRIGEVTLNEALARWAEPSQQEVEANVSAIHRPGEAPQAQAGPGNGAPASGPTSGVDGRVRNQGNGKRRASASRGVQGRGTDPRPAGSESPENLWRRDALKSPGSSRKGRGKAGGRVPEQ